MMDKNIDLSECIINLIVMCLLRFLFDRDHIIKYIGTREKWIIVIFVALIDRAELDNILLLQSFIVLYFKDILFVFEPQNHFERTFWCKYIKCYPKHLKII